MADVAMLAAHPDMIPDLRAYTVYALATTGGAPTKTPSTKSWDTTAAQRRRAGASRTGLRRRRRRPSARGGTVAREGGNHRTSMPLATAIYDELLDFWGDTSAGNHGLRLKLHAEQDHGSPAAQGCHGLPNTATAILVLDEANRDGHRRPDRVSLPSAVNSITPPK